MNVRLLTVPHAEASRPEAIRHPPRNALTDLGYLPHLDDPKDAN